MSDFNVRIIQFWDSGKHNDELSFQTYPSVQNMLESCDDGTGTVGFPFPTILNHTHNYNKLLTVGHVQSRNWEDD